MGTRRVVRFDLSQPLKRYVSSDNYNDVTEKAFNLLDFFYTYLFRYPRLLAVDINAGTHTEGVMIDAMAANPVAAAGVTILLVTAALATAVSEYRQQGKAAEAKAGAYQNSYQRIKERLIPENIELSVSSTTHEHSASASSQSLENHSEPSSNNSLVERSEVVSSESSKRKTLNQHLADLLENDQALKAQYQKIKINEAGQLEMTLQEQKELVEENQSFIKRAAKKAKTFATSIWITLGLSSFCYWLLWIGAAVFTGHLAPIGVDGLGAAGFAVPLAVGGLYPVIKIRNWWKNNYAKKSVGTDDSVEVEEDPRIVLEAAAKASTLLRKAIYAHEKARLIEELKGFDLDEKDFLPQYSATDKLSEELSQDGELATLGQDKWKKTATTFLAKTVSTYVGLQYLAWIVTDILKAAFDVSFAAAGFSIGFGVAFMVFSVGYGIYEAYQKKDEVEKYQAEFEEKKSKLSKDELSLEKNYEKQLADINSLKEGLRTLSTEPADISWLQDQEKYFASANYIVAPVKQEGPVDRWTQVKNACSRAYEFLGGATTGIMIARIATISGSAIFFPFAVAALANPYTIGILVAVGIVYGGFKLYQHYQARKEEQAKAYLAQRAEKVDMLQEQSRLASLQIRLLKEKTKSLTSPLLAKVRRSDDFALSLKSANSSAISSKQSFFKGSLDDSCPAPRNKASFSTFVPH